MLRYLTNRVVTAFVMVLLATLVIFLIANTAPGDPALAQLGDLAASNPEYVKAFRAKWGLDLPLWERYWIFLKGIAHGDFGISIMSQRPVLDDIRDFAPATIELATIAFLLSILVGIPLGILAAVKRDSWIDHVARFVSLIGVSAPTFWLAFIMLAVFYGWLEIAPGPGRVDPIALLPPKVTGMLLIDCILAGDWETLRDAAAHLVLAGHGARGRDARPHHAHDARVDAGVAVAGLRARGAREGPVRMEIVLGHALPNALIPVVTLGGLAYASLLTGAVMTETVFSWPGLGRYTFRSAVAVDFPAIMAITFIVAVVYIAINFLVDMSYALPRPAGGQAMTRDCNRADDRRAGQRAPALAAALCACRSRWRGDPVLVRRRVGWHR